MPPKPPPPPPPPQPSPPPRAKAQRRMSAAQLAAKVHSVEQQKELFLYKYQDITRQELNEMLKVYLLYSHCVSFLSSIFC